MRPPDLMHSEWRCDTDGVVLPFHVPRHVDGAVVTAVCARVLAGGPEVPLWCPWPMPVGWTVTGVGWVGDDRHGPRATVLACSGPGPVEHGPADVLLIAEEPGVGLGSRFAGIHGPYHTDDLGATAAQARVRAAGWPTPLWVVDAPADRCGYVGEARGLWIFVVSWPVAAGYVLAEDLELVDLVDAVPSHLPFGAPTPYLHGRA